jgi:hypothetical protein
MKKRVAGGAVALVAAAGAAYYGLVIHPDRQFHAGLDSLIAKLPPSAAAKYASAHYSPFGKKATIEGLTLDSSDAPEYHLKIERIEIVEPNAGFAEAWNKAKADPAAVAPDLAVPVAREIVISGVTFAMPNVSSTVGELRQTGARVYPHALLQFDPAEIANALQITRNPAEPPDLNALRPILRAEAAAMMGVAFDSYTASDMSVKFQAPMPGAGPVEISATLKRSTNGAFDRGVFAGASAEDMTESLGPLGGMRLNRLTLGAGDFRDAATKLLAGSAVDASLLDNLSFDGIRYEGMELQTPLAGLIKLGAFTIGKLQFAGGLPVMASLGFEKLHLTRSQLAVAGPNNPLDMLGLDAVTISLGMGFAWDVAGQHIALKDTGLKIDELGELRLAGDIGNASRDMSQAALTHASFAYTDGSLADRMIAAIAKQQKLDPAVVRQRMVAAVQQQGASVAKTPTGRAVAQAIATFLQTPKSLTIDLAPPQPIPLPALQGLGQAPPLAIFQALGPTVTANQ